MKSEAFYFPEKGRKYQSNQSEHDSPSSSSNSSDSFVNFLL